MGLLGTLGDIALSIVEHAANQSNRSMDRQSHRRDLTEEQRERFRNASSDAKSLADSIKEYRENLNEDE